MSEEEQRAKPLLQLLVEGRFLALSPKDMVTLATWVALKLMVVDQKEPEDSVVTQADRSLMYRNRSLPAGLKVWIFRTQSDQFDATFYQHAMGLVWGTPDVIPDDKNIKSLTFGFGQLMVYATYMRDASFYDSIKLEFTGGDIPIWPITKRGAIWPPVRPLTYEEALDISGTLRKLWMAPGVGWIGE